MITILRLILFIFYSKLSDGSGLQETVFKVFCFNVLVGSVLTTMVLAKDVFEFLRSKPN